ncbi:MAG TPA: hypothetical protein PLA91_06000, partial [Bacillota bacterium]|nr:hypothetical protein [Bacillota bacterium]
CRACHNLGNQAAGVGGMVFFQIIVIFACGSKFLRFSAAAIPAALLPTITKFKSLPPFSGSYNIQTSSVDLRCNFLMPFSFISK